MEINKIEILKVIQRINQKVHPLKQNKKNPLTTRWIYQEKETKRHINEIKNQFLDSLMNSTKTTGMLYDLYSSSSSQAWKAQSPLKLFYESQHHSDSENR